MITANDPQCNFLELPHKFKAFVAGFGSGKTWVGGMSQCIHFLEHPKVNQGYFAPTFPQIRDIYYPTIEEVAHSFGLRTEIREGNKEVHVYSGKIYRGTTICRSMERPGSIIGFKIGHALVDELDTLPTDKAKQAWQKIIARMRYNLPGLLNGIDVTTTPEGFKFTHELFVELLASKPELAKNYGLIQASTYDNEANLPDDYIPSLHEIYPAELIEAYLNGQFVNLASGTVYRSYDRKRHATIETVQAHEALHVGIDFNVEHMAARVFVIRKDGWHCVDELNDVYDTPDMARILNERFPNHVIYCYPDASGGSRKSVDASVSDISTLQRAGLKIRANKKNPFVKDRVMSVNKQLQIKNIHVNAQKCPVTASCLEKQSYDPNGEPDKKAGFDHSNDAFGYPIAYMFPINKPAISSNFSFAL